MDEARAQLLWVLEQANVYGSEFTVCDSGIGPKDVNYNTKEHQVRTRRSSLLCLAADLLPPRPRPGPPVRPELSA